MMVQITGMKVMVIYVVMVIGVVMGKVGTGLECSII